MGGWEEEVFYSQWRVGQCSIKLNESEDEVIKNLVKAYELRPHRIESLHTLAEYLREKGRHALAYIYAKAATAAIIPEQDILFIFRDIYNWKALDELAVNAFKINKFKEAFAINKHLVEGNMVPADQRDRIARNLQACAAKMGVKLKFKDKENAQG
jgi:propanediol dehydratase small subunit